MSPALRPGEHKTTGWSTARDKCRDAILTQGWSDRAGAFTQTFGSDQLDASTLLLAIVGFLPPDDTRLLATIERDLTDDRGLPLPRR